MVGGGFIISRVTKYQLIIVFWYCGILCAYGRDFSTMVLWYFVCIWEGLQDNASQHSFPPGPLFLQSILSVLVRKKQPVRGANRRAAQEV